MYLPKWAWIRKWNTRKQNGDS